MERGFRVHIQIHIQSVTELIRNLQKSVPDLARELEELEYKLIDLHPVVRDYVYHPGFEGSFSLKHILNSLVPELTYDDLVIINGLVASVEIARFLFVSGKIPETFLFFQFDSHDRARYILVENDFQFQLGTCSGPLSRHPDSYL